MEPAAIAGAVSGAMEPEGAVDMSLELMDLDALDTGRYHAMVVEDPGDRRNLTGFFHLAPIYSPNVKGVLAGSVALSGSAVSAPEAVRNVVEAVNRYTSLRADVIEAIPYNSEEIMKIPCLLIYLRPLRELQVSESENLGRYLISGGFAWCEDDNLPNTCGAPYMRAILREALGSQDMMFERDWQFERLPPDHGLFHCFFDFDGLPAGCDLLSQHYSADPKGTEVFPYLEGVAAAGRLVLVLSAKNYIPIWGYWGNCFENVYGILDRTRHFHFAVNVIVFALTQEGSVTHRVMDAVR